MYESKTQAPLPNPGFARRLLIHIAAVLTLLAVSLGVGMWGYSYFENLATLDAFLNSAMLLGGMGPVHLPASSGGKLFAGIYALYAGLVFILSAALIFAPIVHRVLHMFHWSTKV
jgi:hypothetical protein